MSERLTSCWNFTGWPGACTASCKANRDSVSIPLEMLSLNWVFFVTCSCDCLILLFRFSEQMESGLIEVISPPASYYPDMENLRSTLGDSPERVRWRSKQNLDFAFLMMYAQPKATFYVQLEDDILAKKNFISIMKNHALQRISEKSPWFVLEFCQLGFIGEGFCSFLKRLNNF